MSSLGHLTKGSETMVPAPDNRTEPASRIITHRTAATLTPDIERRSSESSLYTADPLDFKSGFTRAEDLTRLRKSGKRSGKLIADYQSKQNELISSLLTPMEAHTEQARAAEAGAKLPVRIAVYASLIANVVLSGLQLYAAITSGSLSFLATAIDSVFDPGSNLVLNWLHKKADKLDINKWPVGGSRLENVGNIVYGSLMAAVNLVVIVESLRDIITHKGDDVKVLFLPSVIAVAVALGVKFMLFLYCFSIRKHSSQVQVLWEDHRNDLFINGFGLLMSAGGSKWAWFLDPMGGVIIASGTILAWCTTIYKEFALLIGKSAPQEFLKLVIYNAMTFSEDILKVDTVRAYHSGPSYFVEVDIVMDPNTPLIITHDISQMLQDKIEELPGVERAFVHVDHETSHLPEHRKKV